MAQTFLEGADLKWLADIHYPEATRYACAILHGTEDGPDRVELYARNHVECKPLILINDPATGRLVVHDRGEEPAARPKANPVPPGELARIAREAYEAEITRYTAEVMLLIRDRQFGLAAALDETLRDSTLSPIGIDEIERRVKAALTFQP